MCNHKCDAHEIALGWPIENLDGELVCPSCYGEEAFCACGAVLPANCESSVCADCKDPSKVEFDEDAESTLTAAVYDGRMTVEDSDGGRWWPTDAGQNAIDAAEDPEEEAIRLAESHDRTMGEWRQ